MILVVGAGGELGSLITRQLLGQHQEVRILVRPGSPYEWLANLGAHPKFGNPKHPASLVDAFRGIETLITTATASVRGEGNTLQTFDPEINHNLIDAAKAAGVKQFIFVSALGASPNYPSPFFALEGKTEEYLKASGVPYTILQPGIFMETWINTVIKRPLEAGMPVTVVGDGKRLHAWISEQDVAMFAIQCVGNPNAINQTFPLAGPEPLRWRDVIETYERISGQKLQVRYLEPGKHFAGVEDAVVSIMTYMALTETPISGNELAQRFGVKLTPVAQVIREMTGMSVV